MGTVTTRTAAMAGVEKAYRRPSVMLARTGRLGRVEGASFSLRNRTKVREIRWRRVRAE
jgi:hypothetical protein